MHFVNDPSSPWLHARCMLRPDCRKPSNTFIHSIHSLAISLALLFFRLQKPLQPEPIATNLEPDATNITLILIFALLGVLVTLAWFAHQQNHYVRIMVAYNLEQAISLLKAEREAYVEAYMELQSQAFADTVALRTHLANEEQQCRGYEVFIYSRGGDRNRGSHRFHVFKLKTMLFLHNDFIKKIWPPGSTFWLMLGEVFRRPILADFAVEPMGIVSAAVQFWPGL